MLSPIVPGGLPVKNTLRLISLLLRLLVLMLLLLLLLLLLQRVHLLWLIVMLHLRRPLPLHARMRVPAILLLRSTVPSAPTLLLHHSILTSLYPNLPPAPQAITIPDL